MFDRLLQSQRNVNSSFKWKGGLWMTELKVEPLITQEEMAEILHCHITQVSMLREVGILPA